MGWVANLTLFLVAAYWLLLVLAAVRFWPLIRVFTFAGPSRFEPAGAAGSTPKSAFGPGHHVQAHDPAAIVPRDPAGPGGGEAPDAMWRAANAGGGWRTGNTASALARYSERSV